MDNYTGIKKIENEILLLNKELFKLTTDYSFGKKVKCHLFKKFRKQISILNFKISSLIKN